MKKHFIKFNQKKYLINIGNQFLGRSKNNEFCIFNKQVSSNHLIIYLFNNTVSIMDLKSTNGTAINNRKINSYEFNKLNNNDSITIGDIKIDYNIESETNIQEIKKYTNETLSVLAKYDPTEFSKEALYNEYTDYQELHDANKKLGFLYSFGQSISNIFDLKELFNFILKELFSLFPMSSRSIIFLFKNNKIEPHVFWKNGNEQCIEKVEYSNTIVNLAVKEKKGFIASDFKNKVENLSESIINLDLKCTMLSPLILNNNLQGLILLESSKSIKAFNHNDLKLLSGICNLVSVKINNKKLISKVKKQALKLKNSKDELEKYSKTLEKNNLDLIKAKNIAEKANKLKSDFLSNISHEMRTPLNSILGFSDLLKTNNQESVIKYAFSINKNGNRLMNLINDIINLSIIDSQNEPVKNSTFSLKSFCNLKNELDIYLVKKDITVKFNFSPELPNKIHAKKEVIHHILLNLLTNSAKFTDKGSINVNFSYLEKTNNFLKIEVIDTGIGIKNENIEKVFEEFYLIDGENQKNKGSGLGLAIVKRLVKKLNGEIKVNSVYRKGSNFSFYFKVDKIEQDQRNINIRTEKFVYPNEIRIKLEEISKLRFFQSSKIQKCLEDLIPNVDPKIMNEINNLLDKLKTRDEKKYEFLLKSMINN